MLKLQSLSSLSDITILKVIKKITEKKNLSYTVRKVKLCCSFKAYKMSALNFIDIFELFEYKIDEPVSLIVIQKLQSWKLIATENPLKCDQGHNLILCSNLQATGGFHVPCRQLYVNKNKKKVNCDTQLSLRKNTFFHKSHLSLYQVVSFSYLWWENMSLCHYSIRAD